MDCKVIFYSAHKTSFCERSLRKSFSQLSLGFVESNFANNSVDFGKQLINAFEKFDIVFVIGGLGIDGNRGMKNIISNALDSTEFDDCYKLKNSQGEDGYVVKCGIQMLVLLPDEPAQIEEIMQGALGRYLLTETMGV